MSLIEQFAQMQRENNAHMEKQAERHHEERMGLQGLVKQLLVNRGMDDDVFIERDPARGE